MTAEEQYEMPEQPEKHVDPFCKCQRFVLS